MAQTASESVAALLTGGMARVDPRNAYWYQRGEYLLAGLIQHVALTRAPEDRHLAEVARLINLPTDEFLGLARGEMRQSPDATVQALAGVLLNPAEETVGSILSMARVLAGVLVWFALHRACAAVSSRGRREPPP